LPKQEIFQMKHFIKAAACAVALLAAPSAFAATMQSHPSLP
jgi:hypothetical protein